MTATNSDVILERMMALHPKIIDLTLDRVWRLLEALGNPQRDLPPVIHIAGTNGKGSTQSMIRAGLEAAGQKVQAYTSPQLARFHERIRLSDGLISEADLARVLEECEVANGGIPITYFEITTAAALLAFSRDPADFCLLEVGLGGRLDATNVVSDPALTIITPVSIDHQQFLGSTLAEIAGEKAGILKRGVPCIVGRQDDDALDVIERKADRVGAPLHIAGRDWDVWAEHGRVAFQDENGLVEVPMPALIGAHQVENAGMVISALRALGQPERAMDGAMTDAVWPARMQRLREGPLVEAAGAAELWLDGGHNPAAGEALADVIGGLPKRPTYLICGMLNTKDVKGYFAPLSAHVEAAHTISIPGETATLSADDTAQAALDVGISAYPSDNVTAAMTTILSECPNARILICGSLYLAGHILRENNG